MGNSTARERRIAAHGFSHGRVGTVTQGRARRKFIGVDPQAQAVVLQWPAMWPRLFIFLALFCALPLPAWAQTVLPVHVEIDTTSDLANLTWRGLNWVDQQQTFQFDGNCPGCTAQGLAITKPPYDRTPAHLQVDLLVARGDAPLQLLVKQGDIGQTRVRIRVKSRWILDQTVVGAEMAQTPAHTTGSQKSKTLAAPVRAPWTWNPDVATLLSGEPVPRHEFGRKVMAFYYGWYGNPQDSQLPGAERQWRHWDPQRPDHASTNTPQLGWYDSTDPNVIAQHIAWAQQAGIEALVLSWWQRDAHEIAVLQGLLNEAAKHPPFGVSLYLESGNTPEELRGQLDQILLRWGTHPAWVRVDGKIVVFVYTRIVQALGNDGMRKAFHDLPVFVIGDLLQPSTLEAIGGAHQYVSADTPDQYQQNLLQTRTMARLRDKLCVATVMPGFDDTHIRSPGAVDHRQKGHFYEGQWAIAAQADWVVLTSFNEWHEGSEIEPSLEHGSSYLLETKKWIERWRR